MISELIKYAQENNLGTGLYWTRTKCKIVNVETGVVRDGTSLVLRRKTLDKTTKTNVLFEKGRCLQLGASRDTFVATLKSMGTDHALPGQVVRYLEEGGSVPFDNDPMKDPMVTFESATESLDMTPGLRSIADEILTREDQDFIPGHGICTQCATVGPLVRLHKNGLSEVSSMAPMLLSWSRRTWGRKVDGENLPMCLSCMRLYTNAVNALCRDYGQNVDGGKIFPLGNDGILIRASNDSTTVEIVQGIGPDLRAKVPMSMIMIRRGDVDTLLNAIKYKDKDVLPMIENMSAPPLSCPGTKCGELFAYLDRAAQSKKMAALDISAAMASPRVFFTRTIPIVRMAMIDDGDLPVYFKANLAAGMEGMDEFPAKLTEDQKGRFLVAYCKTTVRRYTFGKSQAGPTPHALRLGDALIARGVKVRYEVNVWGGEGPVPDVAPEDGWIAKGWYRIDLVLDGTKIAIEVDGGGRDYDADREREHVLCERGWTVRRVTNGNLSTDEGVAKWADRFADLARKYQITF